MRRLVAIDFDKLFAEDAGAKVIPCEAMLKREEISAYISSMFHKEANLSFVATCSCGHLEGNYFIGTICNSCKTEVKSKFADDLKFRAWLEIPDYLPKMLHPAIYRVCRKSLGSYRGRKVIDILLDPDGEMPPGLEDVRTGYTNIFENFLEVIDKVLTTHKSIKSKDNTLFRNMLVMYSDRTFVQHAPILNQHLTTSEGTMTYVDESVTHVFNAITELNNATYSYNNNPGNTYKIDEFMHAMYKEYVSYVSSIIESKITQKSGIIRKYLLGTRMFNSFRGVITPIVEDHMGDELHVPWRVGVSILKHELLNVMMNRHHYTLNDALSKYNRSLKTYDKDIDTWMQQLIEECPYKGLPVLFGRNPCLNHGSIQLLFITRIKTDLYDNAIGFSELIVSAPNADYDGDTMFGFVLKEMDMVPRFMTLHPMTTLLGADTLELMNSVKITTQTRIACNAWYRDKLKTAKSTERIFKCA